MIKKITDEGEIMPSFYYGRAYHKWDTYQSVWYSIPLNYIVRVLIWLYWKWNKFRGKGSWIDDEILKALYKNDERWLTDLRRAWEEATYYKTLYEIIKNERDTQKYDTSSSDG